MKFLILLLFTSVSTLLDPNRVLIALNCGGKEYVSPNGIVFSADDHFSDGDTSEYGANQNIENTDDSPIYQSERIHSDDFLYRLPLLNKDGKITLILKFVEIFFNSSEERLFDVAIGDVVLIRNLDLYARVGKQTALDIYFELEMSAGTVSNQVV